jgi:hypothetical protein
MDLTLQYKVLFVKFELAIWRPGGRQGHRTELYLAANYNPGSSSGGGELGEIARPLPLLELHAGLALQEFERRKNRVTPAGTLAVGLRVYVTPFLAAGLDHTRTVLGDEIVGITRFSIR